jgi:4-hydroxy-tetrahydrodipicolinate synthase
MTDCSDAQPLIWSATPTPFTDKLKVDKAAVRRLVEHHARLGVSGLFLLGTCGEGAFMTDRQRTEMVETVAKHNAGRMRLAVQVTDNSAGRIIDNMRWARDLGADVAVIAPPYFYPTPAPEALFDLYAEAAAASPLPVGIYDRGKHGAVLVPDAILKRLYALPRVTMLKDSSSDPVRAQIALTARRQRPGLLVLDGDEWIADQYVKLGYDGLLLGGAVFNAHLASLIVRAGRSGDEAGAAKLQQRMNRLMWDVYGGKKIACWLAGLKHLLVEMGIFTTHRNLLGYELSKSCANAIARALVRERDMLFPWKAGKG